MIVLTLEGPMDFGRSSQFQADQRRCRSAQAFLNLLIQPDSPYIAIFQGFILLQVNLLRERYAIDFTAPFMFPHAR